MPKTLILSKMHEAQLEQLTGCRYGLIVHLTRQFKATVPARGRPHQNGPLVTIVFALMKLRLNVSGRVLEALTGIDTVTVYRCINRSLNFLTSIKFKAPPRGAVLIVDTTSSRVASTSPHRTSTIQGISITSVLKYKLWLMRRGL